VHTAQTILDGYAFFRDAAPAFRADALRFAQRVTIARGTVVSGLGNRGENVALLGRGTIRLFVAAESGREVTLYHVGPGELCPVCLFTVLFGRTPPTRAVAETDTDAVFVPGSVFRQWVECNAALRGHVMDALAHRFGQVMEQIQEISFGRLDERLAEYLRERFTATREIVITHERLAAELSTAREVVSRLLRDLQRRGAIRLARGRIALLDPQGLDKGTRTPAPMEARTRQRVRGAACRTLLPDIVPGPNPSLVS